MAKVKVNKDACIGCGLCVSTQPDVFEFDDEGKASVIDENAEVEVECPAGAIEVE